jgi:tRNA-specific 2-thiouridylase
MALEAGLANHARKDSTGICFIGERNFKQFLSRYLPAQPGDMRTPAGELKGRHDGLMYYTLGQRQGLGIGGEGDAWYVAGKDLAHNVLYVVQGDHHPALYSTGLQAADITWITGAAPNLLRRCAAKTRYRQADQGCEVRVGTDGQLEIEFDTPQRAVTPGQSVVLYDGEICLGGATIVATRGPWTDAEPATSNQVISY